MNTIKKLFLIDKKGRISIGVSRRDVLIGGVVCLAVWPGMGLIELALGLLKTSQLYWLYVSPWVLMALLGVWLLGMALFAHGERMEFIKQSVKEETK